MAEHGDPLQTRHERKEWCEQKVRDQLVDEEIVQGVLHGLTWKAQGFALQRRTRVLRVHGLHPCPNPGRHIIGDKN